MVCNSFSWERYHLYVLNDSRALEFYEKMLNISPDGWIISSFECWAVRKNIVGGLLYSLVCCTSAKHTHSEESVSCGRCARIIGILDLAAAARELWARPRSQNNGTKKLRRAALDDLVYARADVRWIMAGAANPPPVTCNISLFSEIKLQNMRQVRVARRDAPTKLQSQTTTSVRVHSYILGTWQANYFAL